MVNAPKYKITVNGADVTAQITQHLVSITVCDNEKNESDELTIVVGKKFQRPKTTDKTKVYIGFDEIKFVGLFHVQKTTIRDNQELTITATGINFDSGLKTRKHKRYEQTTLSALAKDIAGKHGLQVRTDVDQLTIDVDQVNESDLNLLNRLAKEHNAVFNIKNDTLYFMQREIQPPSLSIDINKCISSEITHSNKTGYKSCHVIWHDTKLNKWVGLKVGDGEPKLTKQGNFKSETEARAYADNAINRAGAGTAEGTLTHPGVIAFSGGRLNVDGGEYTITRVEQTLDSSGWVTSLEFSGRAAAL